MEVDKSKCLICEVSCHQKGLAFFKFPKEESRLKIWIKEISPLLDILKIQHSSLKENGRICARHFREKDFINCKRDSLVHNACPSLSVSNLNFSSPKKNESSEDGFLKNGKHNDESDRDIFQCGRCKVQFEILSEFIDHKRLKCQLTNEKSIKRTEISEPSTQSYLVPLESSFSKNFEITKKKEANNCFSDQIVKIINQDLLSNSKIVPLIENENSLVIGNPAHVSACPPQVILLPRLPLCFNGIFIGDNIDDSLAGQVILTPQTQVENSIFLNNIETESQISNLIVTNGTKSNKSIIYTYPLQNSSEININSQVPSNHFMVTAEIPKIVPDEAEGCSDKTVSYCKLVSGVNASQATLLNLQEKKESNEVGKSNQREENVFDKSKTKLPCPYCGKVFEKPFNLQQHERVHTGERPFQCIVCGRAFSQKSNVRKHMIRHKVWPKGKQTLKLRSQGKENPIKEFVNGILYSCQYCTLSFKSYAEHKKHLAVHSNYKVYRCIQKGCSETFSDLDEFLSHSKMHSSAEFQCHICLKAFSNLEELGIHQYDHDSTEKKKQKENEIKLKCKVCHARFKTVESLKNHLAVDTHKYECVHCESVFSSERFLRRHLFIHVDSSSSKFRCQNCKKSFRTQQNLKNHIFIHLKEKPFTCDHCNKQFASKYRLKRHVAIHLNQHLECPFKKHLGCDKTFYRKDKLKDHISTHNHCRMWACRICSKTYWTLSKLHEHMENDHKVLQAKRGEELKCFTCFQTFRKQRQLSLHHCTVEGRKSISQGKKSESRKKEKNSKAVSNIEIIMVPFGVERI